MWILLSALFGRLRASLAARRPGAGGIEGARDPGIVGCRVDGSRVAGGGISGSRIPGIVNAGTPGNRMSEFGIRECRIPGIGFRNGGSRIWDSKMVDPGFGIPDVGSGDSGFRIFGTRTFRDPQLTGTSCHAPGILYMFGSHESFAES